MKIEELIKKLQDDPRNRSYTERGIPPIFQVSPNAKLLIVGQAPGSHVEKSRIPFHDRSGETLMRWLGISGEVFYSEKIAILPMDFYYPGKGKTGDLPPRPFIFKEYHRAFLDLMPEAAGTILVGKYAIDGYLQADRKRNLTETVRSFRSYMPTYFPIVHPSPLNFRWQKNNPWFTSEVVLELQKYTDRILHDA